MDINRRSFLASGAAATGEPSSLGRGRVRLRRHAATAADETAAGDLHRRLRSAAAGRRRQRPGVEYFACRPASRYVVFGKTGTPMVSDPSLRNPSAHDGMAAFDGPGRPVRLTRNHEDRNAPGQGTVGGPAQTRYDPLSGGGVSVLDFDPRTRSVVRDFIGVNGTHINCAGGIAWRHQGWLTCEETIVGPEAGYGRKHGYVFLVPTGARNTVPRGTAHPDGPVLARGRRHRPAHRRGLPDRGRRLRTRQRLLPVPAARPRPVSTAAAACRSS